VAESRRFWIVFGALTALWVLGSGTYGVVTWPAAVARVNATFEASRRDCVVRYPTPERRRRCIDLHDIVRRGDWNQALFERVLLALGPPGFGFGCWLFVRIYRRLR
jgi:hypothetical protein